jgi:hypothetical protein
VAGATDVLYADASSVRMGGECGKAGDFGDAVVKGLA